MEKRKNRSDKYQWVLLETSYSNDMIEIFCNESGMFQLNPFETYSEKMMELRDQLIKEFWRVAKQLTERQYEVITLYSKGLTQMEIAKKLNVNQSSVNKSMHGNVDYKNGKKVYGGAEKKLAALVKEDKKIKRILEKMKKIQEETW